MLIFWKERLVFLSTPKTGTSSIESALESLAHVAISRPPELKHTSARRYRRHLAPLLEAAAGAKFTSIALMREPIDWLGSWYRYRQRDDLGEREKSTRGMSFEDAAHAYLHEPAPVSMNVGSQARFLCDGTGAVAADRVFRYEDIGTFLHFLEDRLGCEIILPRLNVSPKGALDLRPQTAARLKDRLADDYRIYESLA